MDIIICTIKYVKGRDNILSYFEKNHKSNEVENFKSC